MAEIIIKFVLHLIESVCIYLFMTALFPKRFRSRFLIPAASLLTGVIVYLLPDISYVKAPLVFLLYFCGGLLLFRVRTYIACAAGLISIYIFFIINILTGSFLSVYTGSSIPSALSANLINKAIFLLIVKGLDFLFLWLAYRFLRKIDFFTGKKFWILFDIVMLAFVLITYTLTLLYPAASEWLFFILSMLIFFMSMIMFYFFVYGLKTSRENQKLLILESSYLAIKENALIQAENNEKLSRLRHDLKNHAAVAKSLIERGNYIQADEYLDKIAETTENIKFGISQTSNNSIIDSIISYKASVCSKLGIGFEYSLDKLPQINAETIDISSLISNLLDNAIDAAATASDPYINIKIFKYSSYLSVVTSNTFSKQPVADYSGELPVTSKPDKNLHGYGTRIIADIAEKYNGNFTWNVKDGRFNANAMLRLWS